jgi:allantoin racemase
LRILVINPNSTSSMTEKIAVGAASAAASTTTVVARNPLGGPKSIQGPEDGVAAVPWLMQLVDAANEEDFDCVIIACFDDTGLADARLRSRCPVIGIGEAAFLIATLVSERFSVVTTVAESIPVIEANIVRYGWARRCARVRASDVPVLDLESKPEKSRTLIEAQINAALAEDGVAAIVLGCAGMTDLASELSSQYFLPVIDGVAAAIKLAEATAVTMPIAKKPKLQPVEA